MSGDHNQYQKSRTSEPVGYIYEDDEGRMMFTQMPHPDSLWEPVYRNQLKGKPMTSRTHTPENIKKIQEHWEAPKADMVNHPPHYKTGGIETIDYIEAKELDFHLGNAVKYISRAEHKGTYEQDLQKAIWYLNRAIEVKKITN